MNDKKRIVKSKTRLVNKAPPDLEEVLYEKAFGYTLVDTVEEYTYKDGVEELSKKKVTNKNIPPDLNAIQQLMVLRKNSEDYDNYSTEQLEVEYQKIKNLLIDEIRKEEKNGN